MYATKVWGRDKDDPLTLWDDDVGPSIFRVTIPQNRYKWLTSVISFDDSRTRKQRYAADKFAVCRGIFETFQENCLQPVKPADYLSCGKYSTFSYCFVAHS